jgi:hypothetical protein
MTQRLNTFFTGSPELRDLAQRVGQLAALERLYRNSVPATLADASRVIGLERQNLVIGADNGAVAAKLRQLAPHILLQMQGDGVEVTGILVKVQVGQPLAPPSSPPPALGKTGREQIAILASTLDNSPLKSALLRLIKR